MYGLGAAFAINMYTLSCCLSKPVLSLPLLFVQGKDVEMAPTTSNDAPAKEAEFKPKKAPRKL